MKQAKASTFAFLLLTALGAAACDSSSEQKTPAPPPPSGGKMESDAVPAGGAGKVSGVVAEQLVQGKAKVVEVRRADRHVVLQREDGEKITVACSDAVRNFDQIQVGDTVNVGYYESLAYEVRKPGEPGGADVEGVGAVGRAAKGDRPGAAAVSSVKITATIVAIDTANMRVSLKGPDGNVVSVRVRDADKLSRVAVGDQVDIVYSEAMAVSVTKE